MLGVLCLLQSLYAYGRDIKTVNLTENEIYPLKLVLGKTTLLRFSERPLKIIFGNKNYFNIENSETDVAIQPLSRVSTNMFVYTEKQTFGFDISVCEACHGDDFIKVFPKTDQKEQPYQSFEVDDFKESTLKKEISLNHLKITFEMVKSKSDLILIDFYVSAKKSTSSKDIKISVGGSNSLKMDMVFQSSIIFKDKIRGRLVIYQNPKRSLDLSIHFFKQTKFLKIERSLLR